MSITKSCAIGAVGLAAALFLGLTPQGQTAEKSSDAHHGETMQACAKACADCQRECDACATHCGVMLADGKKDHLTTLMTCQDCATVCSAAAQIVSRVGPFSAVICEACADACAGCARECEKFSADAHMTRCAQECRKCEKACRDMAKEMKLKL